MEIQFQTKIFRTRLTYCAMYYKARHFKFWMEKCAAKTNIVILLLERSIRHFSKKTQKRNVIFRRKCLYLLWAFGDCCLIKVHTYLLTQRRLISKSCHEPKKLAFGSSTCFWRQTRDYPTFSLIQQTM